jgi:hypothetical protein
LRQGGLNIDFYFVVTGASSVEFEVVREAKPPKILVSYHYFRNKPLNEFIEKIGYKPEIMLDSGAFSSYSKGKNIALLDYMKYIEQNQEYISCYISLDAIGDPDITYWYYKIMKEKGFKPIPVYHYGSVQSYLDKYIELGEKLIALGATVFIKDKNEVSSWIRFIKMQYQEIDFHLLGSSSKRIIDYCDIHSCDSSTWIMMAMNGYPKDIKGKHREAKKKRALWNMRDHMNYINLINA